MRARACVCVEVCVNACIHACGVCVICTCGHSSLDVSCSCVGS